MYYFVLFKQVVFYEIKHNKFKNLLFNAIIGVI